MSAANAANPAWRKEMKGRFMNWPIAGRTMLNHAT